MAMECDVRIGTSGWHYPSWRGGFYPAGLPPARMLEYYQSRFGAVEVNNSFYRLPSAQVLAAWRDATPAGFCFAVKASRYVTHMKKLRDPEAGLARLLPLLDVLGAKLGPVLFQLPPRWGCDPPRLADFLRALPAGRRYAFEFRDPSWHTTAVCDLLARHGAAFCVFDLAGLRSPRVVTAELAYLRLHGHAERYGGRYAGAPLRDWARWIAQIVARVREVHVYFDNDRDGHAPLDALALRALLGGARAPASYAPPP